MRRARRPPAVITGTREARAIASNLGRDTKATRRRRGITQAELGAQVDLGQSQISYLERGYGSRTSVESWVAIGIALGRPIAIGFTRDVVQPLSDEGHLAAQELVARIAGAAGWRVTFEAPNDPRAPSGSTDVRLERAGTIAMVEIWNRLDDLGAGARSTDRKLASAPPGTRSVWIFVDTAANRRIARAFPTILRARFPGSASRWVDALMNGAPPPSGAGLLWIDLHSRRLRAVRLSIGRSMAPSSR